MKERRVLRFDLEGERGSMRGEREWREGEGEVVVVITEDGFPLRGGDVGKGPWTAHQAC